MTDERPVAPCREGDGSLAGSTAPPPVERYGGPLFSRCHNASCRPSPRPSPERLVKSRHPRRSPQAPRRSHDLAVSQVTRRRPFKPCRVSLTTVGGTRTLPGESRTRTSLPASSASATDRVSRRRRRMPKDSGGRLSPDPPAPHLPRGMRQNHPARPQWLAQVRDAGPYQWPGVSVRGSGCTTRPTPGQHLEAGSDMTGGGEENASRGRQDRPVSYPKRISLDLALIRRGPTPHRRGCPASTVRGKATPNAQPPSHEPRPPRRCTVRT